MAGRPADTGYLISAIVPCRGTFGNGRISTFAPFGLRDARVNQQFGAPRCAP